MISSNNININQPAKSSECITIGRMAPDFIALSTHGYIRLSDYRGKWVILASHPVAFDAVATTEIIRAANLYQEILKRNAVIIGLTTDNVNSNLAWIYEVFQKTGITIIADANLNISELYGMLNPDRLAGISVRDAFFINPYGRIMAIITLPTSCGRNINELLRILDSLQITEKYGLQTPADWQPGDPIVVERVPTNYDELINRVNNSESLGLYCPFWYLCYTNLNRFIDSTEPQNQDTLIEG